MMKSRPIKFRRTLFIPQIMGIFILLVIIISFTAGILRQEAALTFAGAVFLLPWVYCLVMTLFLALIHNRRTRRAFLRISPREITAGQPAEATYCENDTAFSGKIFELPLILVRCRLLLFTKDGRKIKYDFHKGTGEWKIWKSKKTKQEIQNEFIVEKRGAYFSDYDEFAIFDSLGFFRFVFRLPAENTGAASTARLLAGPNAANEPPAVFARSGDSDLQPEFSFQKTDDFIDHRPYVPGDDPRRINWKLYSHGGGLLVRDSEYEPPPHSNILILIDTEYDPALYSLNEARNGIDLLCENALAAALLCKDSGMDVLIGYTGSSLVPNAVTTPFPAFAKPYAISITENTASFTKLLLPAVPDDRGILILALPRSQTDTALDVFLKQTTANLEGKNKTRQTEIFFFCFTSINDAKQQNTKIETRFAAAESCAVLYNRRAGTRAKIIGSGKWE